MGGSASPPFRVHTCNDSWRIDVPLPGIDPQHVELEAAGNSKIGASHRHGMLQLTLPLKENVKPRRIDIEGASDGQKRLTAAA